MSWVQLLPRNQLGSHSRPEKQAKQSSEHLMERLSPASIYTYNLPLCRTGSTSALNLLCVPCCTAAARGSYDSIHDSWLSTQVHAQSANAALESTVQMVGAAHTLCRMCRMCRMCTAVCDSPCNRCANTLELCVQQQLLCSTNASSVITASCVVCDSDSQEGFARIPTIEMRRVTARKHHVCSVECGTELCSLPHALSLCCQTLKVLRVLQCGS